MSRCPSCALELLQSGRFCPGCGAALTVLDGELTGPFEPGPEAVQGGDGARFVPGQVVAGRHRIVTLLGKGGMGQIFRADDLALGQPVALKFLPEHLARDRDLLKRLRNEVALARRVSHPNCCRVYDLGEHDGQPFLTMEFVDGEDLAVLLRRVGRLSEEKAVDVARQLCAALAAVHEQGLLHRDLKPANVMLDGRGKVRLTDFGLAGFADRVHGREVLAGTPAYMAPEQRDGTGVTVQSDLYALGLILYELFTGKHPFREGGRIERGEATPAKPSSHVSGLDAAVEKVTLQCLSREPRDRPRSAVAVAAALPGGDPLAAAQAAGLTPSPEMVAGAHLEGSLPPWVAAGLLVAILLGIALCAAIKDRTNIHRIARLPKSPEILSGDARRMLEKLGSAGTAVDSASSFYYDLEYIYQQKRLADTPGWWDRLRLDRPATMYFWYVQSDVPLDVTTMGDGFKFGKATPCNPPLTTAGMASVFLDPKGRLLSLQVVPQQRTTPAGGVGDKPWPSLFSDAGFAMADFREAEPEWTPPVACDARVAWVSKAGEPAWRIEGATFAGRVTYFEVFGPWAGSPRQSYDQRAFDRAEDLVGFGLSLSVLVLGGPLAYRNWRLGRANVAGAGRLAVSISLFALLSVGVVETHFVADASILQRLLFGVLGMTVFQGLTVWVAYLALEPFVRRRWPWRLVDWNRMMEGKWLDPSLGRGILIGGLAGVSVACLGHSCPLAPALVGQPMGRPWAMYEGAFNPLLRLCQGPIGAVQLALTWLFLLYLVCALLRRERLAAFVIVALATAIPFMGSSPEQLFWVTVIDNLAASLIFITVGLRFGLWSLTTALYFRFMLVTSVMGLDWSTWYAASGAAPGLTLVGISVFGFFTAKAGRPLLSE